jgi:hypothetical protein
LFEEKGKVKDSESSGLNFEVLLCLYLPAETEKYQEFIEVIGRPNRDLNTAHPDYETTRNAFPLQ